jgi:hypothetical protein
VFFAFLFSFLIGCALVPEKPPSSSLTDPFQNLLASTGDSTLSANPKEEGTADKNDGPDVLDDDEYEGERHTSSNFPLSRSQKGTSYQTKKCRNLLIHPD